MEDLIGLALQRKVFHAAVSHGMGSCAEYHHHLGLLIFI